MDTKQLAKDRLAGLGLGYEEDGALNDGRLDYLIEKTKFDILNFTNLDKVPDGLAYVWADRVAGEYLRADMSAGKLPSLAGAAVSSIHEGDTTVDFVSPQKQVETLIVGLMDTAPLVEYRRLRWR
jgi:hypothetical protein